MDILKIFVDKMQCSNALTFRVKSDHDLDPGMVYYLLKERMAFPVAVEGDEPMVLRITIGVTLGGSLTGKQEILEVLKDLEERVAEALQHQEPLRYIKGNARPKQ